MKLDDQDTIKPSIAAAAASRSEDDGLSTGTVHLATCSSNCGLHTTQCADMLSTLPVIAAVAGMLGQIHDAPAPVVSDVQRPGLNVDSIVIIPTTAAPHAGIMPSSFQERHQAVTSQSPASAAVTGHIMSDHPAALGDVLFDSDSSHTSEHSAADNAECLDTVPASHPTAHPVLQALGEECTARNAADVLKLNLQQSQQELQQWQQDHKERIAHAFSLCSPKYTASVSAASHSTSQQLGTSHNHLHVVPASSRTSHSMSSDLQLETLNNQLPMTRQSSRAYSQRSSSGVRRSAKDLQLHTCPHTLHGSCADQQQSAKSKRWLRVFSSQDMNGLFHQQASQPWVQAATAAAANAAADQSAAASLLPVVDELEALADELPDPFALPNEASTAPSEASDQHSTEQAGSSTALDTPVSRAAQVVCLTGVQGRVVADRSRLQHSSASAPAASLEAEASQHSNEPKQPKLKHSAAQQNYAQPGVAKHSAAQHSMARHDRAPAEPFSGQLPGQSQPTAEVQQMSVTDVSGGEVRSNAAAPSVQSSGWPAAHTAQVHKLRHGSTLRKAAFDAAAKAAALAAKADAEQKTPPCIAFHSRAARHALAAVQAAAAAAAVTGAVSETGVDSDSSCSSQALQSAAALQAGAPSSGRSRLDMLCAQLREDDDDDGVTVKLDAGQTQTAEWQLPATASDGSSGSCSDHQGFPASSTESPPHLQQPLLQQQGDSDERRAAERSSKALQPCQQQQHQDVQPEGHCDRHALMQSGNALQAHQQRHVHWQDESCDAQPWQAAELQLSSSPVQQQKGIEDPFRASLAFPVLTDFADPQCQESSDPTGTADCSNVASAASAMQLSGAMSPCKPVQNLNEETAQHEYTASGLPHKMSRSAQQVPQAEFATPVRAAVLSSLGEQEFWEAARADLLDTAEPAKHPTHARAVLTPVQWPASASGWYARHSGITPLIGITKVSKLKSLSPFIDENMEALTANWGL